LANDETTTADPTFGFIDTEDAPDIADEIALDTSRENSCLGGSTLPEIEVAVLLTGREL
jgi:hypothetical protein